MKPMQFYSLLTRKKRSRNEVIRMLRWYQSSVEKGERV